MKIFINPGHGGSDPGAVGNGLKERDVVLKIGKRVEQYLLAVGYDVRLFQYDGPAEICDAANYWDADLFVSIHANAANGWARGTEVFYVSEYGWRPASKIYKQLINTIALVQRGIKQTDNLYVLNHTDMPAVLVETAFIDNPQDAALLVNEEDNFARAIARGISDCFS